MSLTTADTAVTAARAALWTWNAGEGAVSIRAEAGGPLAKLDGRWTLEAFLGQVEGLARGAIAGRLREGRPGDPIDVRLTLLDGKPAHFVGSFHDLGVARGLIVSTDPNTRLVHGETNVEPVFQPIRRLNDLSVAGFEALARFRAPDGQLVGPDTLVAQGGDTDWSSIAPVMLQRSASVLADLRSRGRDVFMQVNLSAAEIARPILVEEVAAIIREAGLPQGVLRVELTEQAALRDFEGALGALAAFRAAGAGIVLDDFGAGHSSFAWLAELPADGVKLDPKLARMIRHPRACRIVTALTSLIRGLGMTVTAEGIEDSAVADELHAIGCDYVQGFAYDLPLRLPDVSVAFDPLPRGV
ncbi:MAG TPA: EAL domain-containing protein [Hyphomonadaceae bacterium]|nr:EAL domain-containing protein [Hyphomonadaceae bacterium]